MKNVKFAFKLFFCVAFFVSLFLGHEVSFAAEYPSRDIVCIVPFKPGGTNDVVARGAAPYLQKYLPNKVNIVVQNIGAAGGRVGSFQLYDSKPDGYTIGVIEPLVFVVAEAMGELGKRHMQHMTWLPRAIATPFMMGVSPNSVIQDIGGLKKVEKVRASVTGSIISGNIAFLRYMGVEPQVIMYGGGAPACLAAMRGDVDLVITTASTLLRQAAASGGKLVPKVVFAEERLPLAPDIPTAKEKGYDLPKEIMTLMSFDAVFAAPDNLPQNVQKILNEAIVKTLQDPAFVADMKKGKLQTAMLSSEQMQDRIAELAKVVPSYIEAIRQALPKVK